MYKFEELPLKIPLHRWSVGDIDEMGSTPEYAGQIWKAHKPIPFNDIYSVLKRIELFNMDADELDRRTANGVLNVQDLDPNKSGYQNVLGFHLEGLIQIGVYPNPWTPDYTGPPRPLPLSAKATSLKCLIHEIGHFYQWVCRVMRGTDDISRLLTAHFERFEAGQTQASNFFEWFAEIFHHIVTGSFSDGKVETLPPELVQLMRCSFYLSKALENRWVISLKPTPTGVMFQTWVGFGWRWRWYSAGEWQLKEWDGQSWNNI